MNASSYSLFSTASRILRAVPLAAGNVRVKVEVKRDSYDEQSYARAWAWSPASLSWNPLADVPSAEMETVARKLSHAAGPEKLKPALRKDADALFALAAEILKS